MSDLGNVSMFPIFRRLLTSPQASEEIYSLEYENSRNNIMITTPPIQGTVFTMALGSFQMKKM